MLHHDTDTNVSVRGDEVVKDAIVGESWNYGPLGGFVNVDVNLGYKLNSYFTVSGQISNLFDAEVREFVASPTIGRLFHLELKVNIPAYK